VGHFSYHTAPLLPSLLESMALSPPPPQPPPPSSRRHEIQASASSETNRAVAESVASQRIKGGGEEGVTLRHLRDDASSSSRIPLVPVALTSEREDSCHRRHHHHHHVPALLIQSWYRRKARERKHKKTQPPLALQDQDQDGSVFVFRGHRFPQCNQRLDFVWPSDVVHSGYGFSFWICPKPVQRPINSRRLSCLTGGEYLSVFHVGESNWERTPAGIFVRYISFCTLPVLAVTFVSFVY
jgi:hypothetical protein